MALSTTGTSLTENSGLQDQFTIYYANAYLWTADGNKHVLGNLGTMTQTGSSPDLYEQYSGPWESLDATGWRVDGTVTSSSEEYFNGWGPASAIDSDGVRYNFANAEPEQEDPNGNLISSSNSGLTDSLGRQIPLTYATSDTSGCPQPPQVLLPVASASTWTVPGPNGSTVSYKLCFASVTVNAPPPGTSSTYDHYVALSGTQTKLQSIVLPNGQTWNFEYNDTDGTTYNGEPVNYGTLTKIKLPTGGTISYTYETVDTLSAFIQGTAGRWVATRSVDANDGTGPHTWTYSYSFPSGFGSSSPTTVTDPLGNYAVHTFGLGGANCPAYETETQHYQNGGTLLKTVTTAFNYTTGSYNTWPCTLTNVVPAQITTSWPNGQTSSLVKTYDSGFNYLDYRGVSTNENGAQNVGIYGKQVSESDSDYGNGSPGPLLRQTKTSFLWQTNSIYLNDNLLNLVSSQEVLNGSGQQVAYTTYGYDEYSLASSGITTQRDSSPPDGSYRGNQTSVSRWLNTTGGYLTATNTFYDTGLLYQTTDPKNNTTTFSYSSNFAGAYATQIQYPTTNSVQHIVSRNYDFNTGLMISSTDENGNSTTYSYDSMWRLVGTYYPDGGQTTIQYNDSSFPLSAALIRKINSSQNYVETSVFDGLGRLTQTQLQTGTQSCPTIYTDYTYDADSRKSTVSNPYCSKSDQMTTYQYDGLGRTIEVIPPDGTSSSDNVLTRYNGNSTTVTDEAGRQRESFVDALGRVVAVDEPGMQPGSPPTPATGSVAISGSAETYTTNPCMPKGNCPITHYDTGTVSITVTNRSIK